MAVNATLTAAGAPMTGGANRAAQSFTIWVDPAT
jgi:hypothetical protein